MSERNFVCLLFIILTNEVSCLRTLLCMSKSSNAQAYDLLAYSTGNNYWRPYAPWWNVYDRLSLCSSSYRSPFLDHWDYLNVTKITVTVLNGHSQVIESEEFDVTGYGLTEWFLNQQNTSDSYEITGTYGTDFLVADPNDERNIKFGVIRGFSDAKIIIDTKENSYYRLPDGSGHRECVYYSNGVPENSSAIREVTNQEECMYYCFNHFDSLALIHSDLNSSTSALIQECYCYHTGELAAEDSRFSYDYGCGIPCTGDVTQDCGNDTYFVLIHAENAIEDKLNIDEFGLNTIMTLDLPYQGTEVTVNLTNTEHASTDGIAVMAKIEVGNEWPELKLYVSQEPCGQANATFKKLKLNFNSNNGTVWFNKLVAQCLIFNSSDFNYSISSNITFTNPNVMFAPKFLIQGEWENDICQYKDIGVFDTVVPNSNIDIWHGISDSDVQGISGGGMLITAYKHPFPEPRIVFGSVTDHKAWIQNIIIKTTATSIAIETLSCDGVFNSVIVTEDYQISNFNVFNVSAGELSASTTRLLCVETVVVQIQTDSVDTMEDYIIKAYFEGCSSSTASTTYSCPSLSELIGDVFPFSNIVAQYSRSAYHSPKPVRPCEEGLLLTRQSFSEPIIITVVILNDDEKESLPVNYIKVTGNVDDIYIFYTSNVHNNTLIPVPTQNITISDDILVADLSPTDMYAIRIADNRTSFVNITEVIIKACILTGEIFRREFLDDNRTCEETTTVPDTTATTITTTTAEVTTQECCACTTVKPTITTQQAEERAEALARELQVDTSTLSSTIRKKTSAKDDRPSAKMVGSLGIILLSVVFGLVVIMDADNIYKIYKIVKKWRRLRKLKLQQNSSSSLPPK